MPSALVSARPADDPIAQFPFARGHVEKMVPIPPQVSLGPWRVTWPARLMLRLSPGLHVGGWMLEPDTPFDRLVAHVNGRELGPCVPRRRTDLISAFPHIPHAAECGFRVVIPRAVARKGRLDVIGLARGRPVARMSTHFRDDLSRRVRTPPAELLLRVSAVQVPALFRAGGYKSYGELRDALERHRPLETVRRLLDWGCGCGRVTVHWLHGRRRPQVFGCDVDRQAIAWCRAHLRGGAFAVTPFDPPTSYPDGYFDAITGYSVFSHLDRAAQRAWLVEMRRVLAPGGVFVASVHGPAAARFVFHRRTSQILADGIHDKTVDPMLTGVLPEGAYWSTYQTEDYTRRVFGKYFEVVEYVERGIGNLQDLVVLRRPY